MTFGEMYRVRELQDLPQEIRPRAEALNDARNLRTPGAGAPSIVGRGYLAGGLSIFDDCDLWREIQVWRAAGFFRWFFLVRHKSAGNSVVLESLRWKMPYTGNPASTTADGIFKTVMDAETSSPTQKLNGSSRPQNRSTLNENREDEQ